MQVNVRRTTVEELLVDIDPIDVLTKLYESSKPYRHRFIQDGYWYVEDGYDYHKSEEMYTRSGPASEQEIAEKQAYQTMVKIAKRLSSK